ncbi:hypothetical protein F4703DRAFT_1978377 [Phycomyces blakesleeanus]
MLASGLPFEIITYISGFLSTKDRISCTFICKAWRTPMQESLWCKVHVGNAKKLNDICDISIYRQNIYRQHGQRVRTLSLKPYLRVTSEQLNIIQQNFQNIRHLHLPEKSLDIIHYKSVADWSCWKSLVHLEVSTLGFGFADEAKEFLQMLSCLPSLRHLSYMKEFRRRKTLYGLDDFETLHTHLPQLEHLSITMDLDVFSDQDLMLIANVVPASNIKVIKFFIDNMDLRWLCYFARKYINVHTLEWNNYARPTRTEIFREEAVSMFASLPCTFQHLRSINMSGTSETEWTHITFWELLSQLNVPIKHITYGLLGNHMEELSEKIISKCMISCAKTLETFSISSNIGFSDPCTIPMAFDVCLCLVDLNIYVYSSPIALDILLDHCVVLKRLRLAANNLSISRRALEYPAMHGIRLIEFIRTKTNADVFSYISFRCRNLNYMRLDDMKISGPFSRDTGNLCLDMPFTHFDILQLNNVQFFGSEDSVCNADTSIHFMALVQLENILQSSTILEPSIQLSDSDHLMSTADSLWFYMDFYQEGSEEGFQLRVLNKDEIKIVREYFMSFQENNKVLESKNGYRKFDKDAWKLDLYQGHATLRCEYVGKYVINNFKLSDSILWDKSYDALT